jgi:hypothetical protein
MVRTIKELRAKNQFFTKKEVSLKCIEITEKYVNMIEEFLVNTCFVEPSAGNGDFYDNFP